MVLATLPLKPAPRLACALMLGALCRLAFAQDLNTATEADLDSIRGSGPAITARILAARQQRPFANWSDVMERVRGIGPATAAKWSAQGVTVHRQPWEAAQRVGVSPESASPTVPDNR